VDVFSGVSLSVCLFVCQHDNFRTIKLRMLKLGRCKKSRPSSNLGSKVKGQGRLGRKTKKCDILFGSHPLGRGPRATYFSGSVLGARLLRWENQRMLSSLTVQIIYRMP